MSLRFLDPGRACCRTARWWPAVLLALWGAGATAADTPVTVQPFSELRIFPKYTAPATVVSLNDSQLSAEASGVIETVTVKPGDRVLAGQTLVTLDCHDHELAAKEPAAQLQAAKAERNLANYRSQRADKLRKRGVMPLEEYQQRKAAAERAAAEVQRLQALVEESQQLVSKCEIKAPFKAVVVKRFASVGELARPGMRLLRLVDTQSVEVSSHVQEQDLAYLRQATRVAFVSHGTSYPVTLRSVVPVLDRRVSSYETRFDFVTARPTPGQSGRIEWRTTTAYLPANLLVQRGDAIGVFIAVRGHASFRILTDARPGQPAVAHLPGDARVIVDGRYSLEDGQPIGAVDR